MLDVRLFQMQTFLPMPYEDALAPRLKLAHEKLQNGSGIGGDFTGWVHLPRDYDKEEFARIKAAAARIQGNSKALVVIGIGGSYLGARGVIECLCSPNYNLKKKDTPNIYFVGNGLSSDSMQEVVDLLGDDDFTVNVISKSGTTTEPAVAFRFFRKLLEEKYGREGARDLGQLIYFFEYGCGLSGYLIDVNPFDQPGVEAYKQNMFALLGKPGYEDRKAELEAKLAK